MRMMLLALLCWLPLPAAAQEMATITVEGRGEVAVTPDMATVTLGVVREGATAAEAMDALATATDAVLARVADEGIAPRDVQTGQLSLQPNWDHSREGAAPRIMGYVARTTIDIRARDLDALGGLLDVLVADGANELGGLGFGLQDPGTVEDEARRAAFAQAMARAELYAQAAGRSLGAVLAIQEGGGPRPMPGPMFDMAAEAARAMPIAPGEVTQVVTVTVIVALAPAE